MAQLSNNIKTIKQGSLIHGIEFKSENNRTGQWLFDGTNMYPVINGTASITIGEESLTVYGGLTTTAQLSIGGATTVGGNITISGDITATGSINATALGNDSTTGQILSTETILTADEIVGTAEGDIGHADGAILVAAPGTGYTLEFISAVLIYDYDTAAYTGGGDDTVINVGVTGTQVALTTAIAKADFLFASGDKIVQVNALTASDQALVDNSAISLYAGTAFTQPGTAAGVVRAHVTYRVHTTGL